MKSPKETPPQITAQEGEAYRVSDCHFVEVENIVTEHPENPNWQSSEFRCTKCGNICRIETNQRVVELRQEIEDLKAKGDKDESAN